MAPGRGTNYRGPVPTTLNALAIRRHLGRDRWGPPEPFGPDGWTFTARDGAASVIVTVADHGDGTEWVHASMARVDRLPTYGDLVDLHRAVWKDTGYAYQTFAPVAHHVNIHPNALHLWGRLDGAPVLPVMDGGSI